ncbi:MAG: 2-hydroxyacyl-CoA dehydratase family protein, partial [Chloroflexota bacterium]
MNFFEAEIAKYDGRIKKVRESPNPSMLKSNVLLYEIWRDHRKRQLKAWQNGEPFVYCGGASMPLKVLSTMGLHPIYMAGLGDRAVAQAAEGFSVLRSLGYPDPACDRTVVPIGLAIGGIIPPPRLAVALFGVCEAEGASALWPARHFNAPTFCFDHPYEHSDVELEYLLQQVHDMIAFLEREVPGARYDERRLVEWQNLAIDCQRVYREIYEFRKSVPCPVSGPDVFTMPPWEINDPRILDYLKMQRDEIRERVDRGYGAVPNERLRISWLVSGPFHFNFMGFLNKLGVAVPFYEFGKAAALFGYLNLGCYGDDSEYGRKLSPLEEEARQMNNNTWGGRSTERRVPAVIQMCRDLKIDALIHYQL